MRNALTGEEEEGVSVMNELQKQAVIWLVIIGLVCWLFDINPVNVISGIVHAGQTMHQANAH